MTKRKNCTIVICYNEINNSIYKVIDMVMYRYYKGFNNGTYRNWATQLTIKHYNEDFTNFDNIIDYNFYLKEIVYNIFGITTEKLLNKHKYKYKYFLLDNNIFSNNIDGYKIIDNLKEVVDDDKYGIRFEDLLNDVDNVLKTNINKNYNVKPLLSKINNVKQYGGLCIVANVKPKDNTFILSEIQNTFIINLVNSDDDKININGDYTININEYKDINLYYKIDNIINEIMNI